VIATGKGFVEEREPLGDLIGGVNVERRAVAADKSFKRNWAATEGAGGSREAEGTRG
jgi:hypothetical protein